MDNVRSLDGANLFTYSIAGEGSAQPNGVFRPLGQLKFLVMQLLILTAQLATSR